MPSEPLINTIIASITGIILGILTYLGQKRRENNKPSKKSQVQKSIDAMVETYEQALKTKNEIIKDQTRNIESQAKIIRNQAEELNKLRSI